MRRTIWLLAGVLLSVVALGSDSPKEYDGRTTADPLEGSWQLTDVEFSGIDFDPFGPEVRTYHDGTYTWNFRERKLAQGSYRIDRTCDPPHLDLIPPDGKTIKCIYQIKGDTLKIASIEGACGGPRPQGFNDDDVVIYIYKRVKK